MFAVLIFLLGPYFILTLIGLVIPRARMNSAAKGRISLAVLFVCTGLSHFAITEKMRLMLPDWVPARTAIIYISGFAELALAAGLLVRSAQLNRLAGISVIVFLILILPANIYSALQRVDFGGHEAGPIYLLSRVPLQFFLIGWAYYFVLRKEKSDPGKLKKAS